jgi:hypothetical protein
MKISHTKTTVTFGFGIVYNKWRYNQYRRELEIQFWNHLFLVHWSEKQGYLGV